MRYDVVNVDHPIRFDVDDSDVVRLLIPVHDLMPDWTEDGTTYMALFGAEDSFLEELAATCLHALMARRAHDLRPGSTTDPSTNSGGRFRKTTKRK